MFIVGLLSWWYGAGWARQARAIRDRLAGLYDYFSIDLLLKTLFSPFRQISAGRVRGSIDAQVRAWLDQLISRVIGMVVRGIVMVIGCVTLFLAAIVGLVSLCAWPLVPLMPVLGIVFALSGWMPWTI